MMKVIWTFIGIAVVLVGWGMTWANQNARICENQGRINGLTKRVETVSEQRALLEVVRSRGGRISPRELMQASRAYRGGAEMARFALEELQQLGWGRLQKVDTSGRPSEIFVLYETDDNERQQQAE